MDLLKEQPKIQKSMKIGVIVFVVFIIIFGTWAIFAPIESASVANGIVVVKTNRKTIEHLEGGIIKKIYVTEGSNVKEGDPVIELEDTQARTNFDLQHGLSIELLAAKGRLIATIKNANEIEWDPQLLLFKNDEKAKRAMQLQTDLFIADKKTLEGQLEILQFKIKESQNEIESLEAQIISKQKQLALINEEIKAVAFLEAKKLIEKPRLWSLQREAARLEGDIGNSQREIAKTQEQIGETKQRLITLVDSTQKDNLKSLTETQTKLLDILERRKNAEDILKRIIIRAPLTGTVVNLQQHTLGGIIRPGEPILDIIPSNDELVIEAHINPIDIVSVHPGLKVRVRLVAYNQRITPIIEGTVKVVSADIFQDPKTNQPYYTVRITINPKELEKVEAGLLYPGMPVNVMIITGKRSLFYYLVNPLLDSFKKAFREK